MQDTEKKNILNFDLDELIVELESLGERSFRAKQIFAWLAKGVESFEKMTNISQNLRKTLEETYFIGLPNVVIQQDSKFDGTKKCLYEFDDGARVETVFMKYHYGNSICISSQVGCRMGCRFCASTISGLERNLTAGEMLAEVLKMKNITCEDINHVVIMGMGEPFDNYDEVCKFIKIIHDKEGCNLSLRNITLSTCGIIPQIEILSKTYPQINLAVSLHASNDNIRKQIMPIANQFSYDDLIEACKKYTEETNRRITFEYSMIDGVNDSIDNALELVQHLRGWLTHVNLIPLNNVDERDFKASRERNIKTFKDILEENGVAVTIRRTLGTDINAACGQLRQR